MAIGEEPRVGEDAELPSINSQRIYVASTIVDSLAGNLVFAFLIVFFQRVIDLGLVEIDGALTLGRLAAMPTPRVRNCRVS